MSAIEARWAALTPLAQAAIMATVLTLLSVRLVLVWAAVTWLIGGAV